MEVQPGSAGQATATARKEAQEFLTTISLENLIQGFPDWWKVFSAVITHPFRFAAGLELERPGIFRAAVRYSLYSILIAFLLMTPVFLVHHAKINKIIFSLRMFSQVMIYGILVHYALRLLGAKIKLAGSVASYVYLSATVLQLSLFLALPWLIPLGPDAVLGGWTETQDLGRQFSASVWMMLFLVFYNVFSLALLYPVLKWFSITHGIRKRRVLIAMFLAGLAGGAAQFLVVVPLFQLLEKALGGFLDLFS